MREANHGISNMTDNAYEKIMIKISEIFSEIPEKIWDEIVRRMPSWSFINEISSKLGFGRSTVLLMMLGLNNYQTKGRAELGYWISLREYLEKAKLNFNEPQDMIPVLKGFFKNERLNKQKVDRLERFLSSELSKEIWESCPEQIYKKIDQIWDRLANTMRQKKRKKTITYAMKCLGICLLTEGYRNFEYNVYIPVDSRVLNLTKRLIGNEINSEATLKFWQEILVRIKVNVNMIYLDSLLWQIAMLQDKEMIEFFNSLGVRDVGNKLISLINSINQDSI